MKKLVLFVVSIFLIQSSFAQWAAMGAGPGGKVRALCVHNGELYAGGDFAGLVKKWNGSSWIAVGSLSGGTSPKVNALISYNGSLYAGGAFSSVQYNVAKLNGTTWVAVGSGLSGVAGSEVKVFYNFNGTLLAGGTFTQSGVASLSKVGKLVGAVWQQEGDGAPGNCTGGVYALTSLSGVLYAGGQGSAPNMNKLNAAGTAWVSVGTGLSNSTGVYSLYPYPYPNLSTPCLFVGGDFQIPSNSICTYNPATSSFGTALSAFSGGTVDQVNAMIASPVQSANAYLYAGGMFTVTGLHSAANLAKKKVTAPWDSVSANFHSGTTSQAVNALCFFGGYLIAGGSFDSAGTVKVNNIARLGIGTVDVEEISSNIIINTFYPNPIIKEALLKVQTKGELQQPELKMLDVNGNELMAHTSRTGFNHSQNEVEFKIDREGLAAGIYYYMVLDEERIVATGKVIVE